MSTVMNKTDTKELLARWQALIASDAPRNREAAARLGVSEAELIAACCGGDTPDLPRAWRLRAEWKDIIESFPELGYVMALTRNDSVVHEKKGEFANIDINGGMGVVLNHDIDLRLFLRRWHFGFAVEEPSRVGLRRSFQFYDLDGTAVHKVYLTDKSNVEAWLALRERYLHDDQSTELPVEAVSRRETTLADTEIDVARLRSDWVSLKDTHDFFPMLRRHKVGRVQAMRLVGPEFARAVANDMLRRVFTAAVERELPIMVFVGSAGVVQIHTGPIRRLKDAGPWFNVLDPAFNLHLKEGDIASSWIVRKPTVDGDVTSLEVFDRHDNNLALIFGERKPGRAELEEWRALLADVERANA